MRCCAVARSKDVLASVRQRFVSALLPSDRQRCHEAGVAITAPGSFRSTGLKDVLDKHGVTDVIVVGAMSHMCADATTRAANDFGYKTTTLAPAAIWSLTA